jgi:NOL1/NOP2/fmu family ribosome biogenesis protein
MTRLFRKYNVLNAKQIKDLHKKISEQWGAVFDTKKEYIYLLSKKDKIYLLNRNLLTTVDIKAFDKIIVDRAGLYFAEFTKYGLRLSMEGSRLIGSSATQNLVMLGKTEARLWLKGQSLPHQADGSGFTIVAHADETGTDYLGCGRVVKSGLENYVPKTRRILAKD